MAGKLKTEGDMNRCSGGYIKAAAGGFLSLTGDCPAFGEFLSHKKNRSPWLVMKFLDAFFRSYSQVMLCNNPISGVAMYVALLFAHPLGAMTSSVTCTLGILVAWCIGQSSAALRNGLCGYNPLLIGMVTAVVHPDMLMNATNTTEATTAWFGVLAGAAVSVYLAVSLATLMGKLDVPALTWSFNITQYLLLLVLWSYRMNSGMMEKTGDIKHEMAQNSTGANIDDAEDEILKIDWIQVLYGCIASSGQVFAVHDVIFSTFVYAAILFFSPIMAASSFLGSACGPLLYFLISTKRTQANLNLIYHGVLGYNPLLTGAALGGFFYKLNGQTAILTFVACMITCVLQLVLSPLYPAFLNAQTVPFCIASCVFLICSQDQLEVFEKPEIISCPERHLMEVKRIKKDDMDSMDFDADTESCSENRSLDDDVRIPVSEEEHAERQ